MADEPTNGNGQKPGWKTSEGQTNAIVTVAGLLTSLGVFGHGTQSADTASALSNPQIAGLVASVLSNIVYMICRTIAKKG